MRDEIYASIGLEKRPRGWYFNGEPCQFDYDAHSPYAAAILARPEYRELVAEPTRKLAAFGFEIFWKLTCTQSAITAWYKSPITKVIGQVTICDRYVNCIVSACWWLKYCDLVEKMANDKDHMSKLRAVQAARARTIAAIAALLPQPIAEEIALDVL
jgi:hypothetical protein